MINFKMIICRAPLRLPIGGGGTDLPSWYKTNGSYLITAAINKYIYITINNRDIFNDYWISYSKVENENDYRNIKHTIIREVIKNFLLNKKGGIEIHTISDLPGSTGMGSSGSLAVGLIHSLFEFKNKKILKKNLAEKASNLEMKINNFNSGIQDQYAAAYGGLIELNISCSGKTKVNKLPISNKRKKNLNDNLFLIYTGLQRNAVEVLSKQSDDLINSANKKKLMRSIQIIGFETRKIILKDNLDNLGYIFDEHWMLKKQFGSYMATDFIDNFYKKLKFFGSTGGKLIGAGGGGFFLSYVPKENQKKFLNQIKKNNIKFVKWSFDNEGSKIIFNNN
jgi:D-glycero-alpha-D-manno-heptose-7-phosphate kinase